MNDEELIEIIADALIDHEGAANYDIIAAAILEALRNAGAISR